MALFKYVECKTGDPVPKDAVAATAVHDLVRGNYIYTRAKCPSGDYVLGVASTYSSRKVRSMTLQHATTSLSTGVDTWFRRSFRRNVKAPRARSKSEATEEYIQKSDEEPDTLQACQYFDKKLGKYTRVDEFEVLTSQAKVDYVQCKTGSAPPKGAIVGCYSDDTGPSYHVRFSYYAKSTSHEGGLMGLPCIYFGTVGVTLSSSNVFDKAWASHQLDENDEFEGFIDEFEVLILDNINDEIKNVEFDDDRASAVSEKRVLKKLTLTNNSSTPQMSNFTYNESVTNAIYLTQDFGADIRAGTEITCAWPSVTQNKIKYNVDEQYKMHWGKRKTIPQSYNGTTVVEVPPNSINDYSAVVTESKFSVPYTIHWLSGEVSIGTWHSVSYWGFEIKHTIQYLIDEIKNVEFDIKKAKINSASKVIAEKELTNDDSLPQERQFNYTGEAAEECYFSHESGVEVEVDTTFQCRLPTIDKGKISLDVGPSHNMQWGAKKPREISLTGSVPVNVPANSDVICRAELTEEKLEVPYKIHWLSGKVSEGTWHSVSMGSEIDHRNFVDKILNVEFDVEKAKRNSAPKVISTQTLTNDTSVTQKCQFTYREEATDECYFSHQFGVEVKVGTAFKCGLPTIAEGKISAEVEASYNMQWGKKKSTTKSFSGTVPVVVPANSEVTCTAAFTEEKLEVPYKIHWLSDRVSEGTWHSVTCYDVRTKFVESKLKTTAEAK